MKRLLVTILCLFLMAQTAFAQIVGTLPFTLTNGTLADASQVMSDFNKILNDTNNNAAHNGANSDITALLGLTTPIAPSQGGSNIYIGGTSTGSANAQAVASLVPINFALTKGNIVFFTPGFTNTGATTLAINGTTATAVLKRTPLGLVPLVGSEILANGQLAEAMYDGTQYELLTNNYSLIGLQASIASATTTDLGTVPGHNALITGTTTITSFGVNGTTVATTTYPIYFLQFNGVLTLTYSSAMLLPGASNIITAVNDTAIVQYLGSGNWQIIYYNRAANSPAAAIYGQGRLQISTSTVVNYCPFNGNFVSFPSGAIAQIPSACIGSTVSNASLNGVSGQTLSINTLYYAYLWNNGSTFVVDWSTTGHATDTNTGIEIKSGDATRVLIGMAYPQTGPNFVDSGANRLVASWFNRQQKFSTASFSTNRTTTSASFVEINIEIRNQFLSWGGAMWASWSGETSTNTGAAAGTAIELDGSSIMAQALGQSGGSADLMLSVSGNANPNEGLHSLQLFGRISGANTLTFTSGSSQLTGVVVN